MLSQMTLIDLPVRANPPRWQCCWKPRKKGEILEGASYSKSLKPTIIHVKCKFPQQSLEALGRLEK